MRPGMTFRVEVSRRAAKAVTSLDKPLRRKILAAIDALSADPRPAGCKKLAGQETWRIRVGDYRIIYEIHDQILLVIVVDIGHRREIYR
jgi:mRNA interferase RelE/StbE